MARPLRIQCAGTVYHVMARCTYTHMNPARTGLIRAGQERLKQYQWSSYPGYYNRAGRRSSRLGTEQVIKPVLAWWLRQSTTASLRWLNQRLAMGQTSTKPHLDEHKI